MSEFVISPPQTKPFIIYTLTVPTSIVWTGKWMVLHSFSFFFFFSQYRFTVVQFYFFFRVLGSGSLYLLLSKSTWKTNRLTAFTLAFTYDRYSNVCLAALHFHLYGPYIYKILYHSNAYMPNDVNRLWQDTQARAPVTVHFPNAP